MRHVVCGEERGGRVAGVNHDERRMIELQMFNYQWIYAAPNRSEPNHHEATLNAPENLLFLFRTVVLVVIVMVMTMMVMTIGMSIGKFTDGRFVFGVADLVFAHCC